MLVPADMNQSNQSNRPNLPNPSTVAEKMIGFGSYVMLIPFGTKRATALGWQDSATRDVNIVRNWAEGNVCVVGKQDGLWYLEFEYNQLHILDEYEKTQGSIKSYRVKSPSGGVHLHFIQNAASWSMGNLQESDESGREMWSARISNRYVLAPGSAAHPHNDETLPLVYYTAIDRTPPIEAPDSLLELLKRRVISADSKVQDTDVMHQVHEGGRNNYLASMAGKARQVLKMDEEEILPYLLNLNQRMCVLYVKLRPDAALVGQRWFICSKNKIEVGAYS